MIFKNQTKILVRIILLINIIFISLFVFVFNYTKNLVEEYTNIENDIKTEIKKESIVSLMKNDVISAKIYKEKLSAYMVPSNGTVDFIKSLEQLITTSDIKADIKNVSNKAYDRGNITNTELLVVSMDIIGEWKNIHYFLELLENYPSEIIINKLTLSKFTDYVLKGRNVPQWTGNLEFTIVKIKDIK